MRAAGVLKAALGPLRHVACVPYLATRPRLCLRSAGTVQANPARGRWGACRAQHATQRCAQEPATRAGRRWHGGVRWRQAKHCAAAYRRPAPRQARGVSMAAAPVCWTAFTVGIQHQGVCRYCGVGRLRARCGTIPDAPCCPPGLRPGTTWVMPCAASSTTTATGR